MLKKVILIYHTVKYLRPIQIYYQLWYRLRKKLINTKQSKKRYNTTQPINWQFKHYNISSYTVKHSFEFLNIKEDFQSDIDWNYSKHGKLWTYNLNYFEFLNQKDISKEDGYDLIKHYVSSDALLKDGKEPYPISLRGINWIKFLSEYKIEDQNINQVLYNDYNSLTKNLEYHLLGNHLLENGFSLLFGAYYFKDDIFYKKSLKILRRELDEEILSDGGHFEGSPMYHQIILSRLLDAIQLIKYTSWKNDNLLVYLESKAKLMLGWLSQITFTNGDVPMVNDAAKHIAPTSETLFLYAKQLEIKPVKQPLLTSGYRTIHKNDFELLLDVGDIQPSYQPGHNHADTFNFVLHHKKQPLIVDVGTSTYNKSERRQLERSTVSHNTVNINGDNSSQVWGGFRIGKRAKVTVIKDQGNYIEASHNGYVSKYDVNHHRTFDFTSDSLEISDELKGIKAEARLHLHPDVKTISIDNTMVTLNDQSIAIKFKAEELEIQLKDYDFCAGFNKTTKAKYISITFYNHLKTTIVETH